MTATRTSSRQIMSNAIRNVNAAREMANYYKVAMDAVNVRVEYDVLRKAGFVPQPAKNFQNVMAVQVWANRNAVKIYSIKAN